MPTMPFDILQEPVDLKTLCNEFAKLQKLVRYLLNGQIDFENIRARSIIAENIAALTLTANEIAANTITADKMDVIELSAITANLGHILAGLIEAVEIYGSYIATANGTYPRVELSSAGNLLGAFLDATHSLKIEPNVGGAPGIGFYDPSGLVGRIYGNSGLGLLALINNVELTSLSGSIDMTGINLLFNGINVMASINAKASSGGSTSSVAVSDGHNHGFTTSDYIQCYDSVGAATVKKQWVPYAGSASHSHTI